MTALQLPSISGGEETFGVLLLMTPLLHHAESGERVGSGNGVV